MKKKETKNTHQMSSKGREKYAKTMKRFPPKSTAK